MREQIQYLADLLQKLQKGAYVTLNYAHFTILHEIAQNIAAAQIMQEVVKREQNLVLPNLDQPTQDVIVAVLSELLRAEEKHPMWPVELSEEVIVHGDFVHAAAIVAEESGELIRAALNFSYEGGAYEDMRKECIQTAAMCIRFLKNMPVLPPKVKEVSNG